MRRLPSLALPLLCLTMTLTLIAGPPQQAAPGPDTKTDAMYASIRQEIREELDKAKPGSVLAFDEDGSPLKLVTVPKQQLAQTDSLESFLDQYTRQTMLDESNSRGGIRGADPIASCDEPRGLPGPPECVVCKNGKIICARTSFAKHQKQEAPH